MFLIMIFGSVTCFAWNHLKQKKDIYDPSGICLQASCRKCRPYQKLSTQLVERIRKKFKQNVIINKRFAMQFLIKFMEMSSKSSESVAKIQVCYHGSLKKNYKSIIRSNLMVPDGWTFCHRTDCGWYGRGIYMSPDYNIARQYSSDSQVFVCLCLPGKRYKAKKVSCCRNDDYGIALKKGYDSHIGPHNKEWVFFDSCQLLPCYLINTSQVRQVETELLKYDIPFIKNLVPC